MSETLGPRISGAVLPRCIVAGRVDAAARWRVGSLAVGRQAIDWSTREGAGSLPLASVVAVTGTSFSLSPPPMPFDQCVLVHHLEANNVPAVTALGFPGVTIGNFPLQLSAALVGTIPVRIVRPGAAPEDAFFSYEREVFSIRRRQGTQQIRLQDVAGVSMRRAQLADGRASLEWTLSFVEANEVARVSLSATERLPFLAPLLSVVQALRRNASLPFGARVDDVPEATQQVAMLLYNGNVRASSVEQMLGLTPEQVDKIYEELLAMGAASVVKVRKEIQLTAAGATLVAAIIKRQMEIPGSVTP